MLRAVGRAPELEGESGKMIRVSSGSAVVLGLETWQLEVPPTTAYLMVGDKCERDCLFCAQARHSTACADQLSRVSWPAYAMQDVLPRLAAAFERQAIERSCLQVTAGRGFVELARQVVREIKAASPVPLCVCIRASHLGLFEALLGLGAERVTLALDAASERVYNVVKGPDWAKTLQLLRRAAERYPGHVGTHVIVGLGETEAEASALMQEMQDWGITIALFAFTPVPGTALAQRLPPPLASYRRLQVARYLIVNGKSRAKDFRFAPDGRIESYGMGALQLQALLADGRAFETSGCPGCNRPYYNERPGGALYNYPRALRPEEAAAATALVIDSLSSR